MTQLDVAQSARLSRITVNRIEEGRPTVAMAAYAEAAYVLGLRIGEVTAEASAGANAEAAGNEGRRTVDLSHYPQLRNLAWSLTKRPGSSVLTAQEALNLYERNWRHVDQSAMTPAERALVAELKRTVGHGVLLV